MRILFLFLILNTILLVGCETINEGARQVGRPVGAGAKTVGSITDGALDEYSDKGTDNPYNR